MHKTLILTLLLAGCGTLNINKKTTKANPPNLENLHHKSEMYLQNILVRHTDENGFILTDKCDSLLFTGLLGAARPDILVNIRAAQDKEGAWHRRPDHTCGPEFGTSRSTISRDMILGLMWYAWRNKDLHLATELMEDLKSNFYILKGEGTAGELLVNPAMLNTLANMIKALGGKEYWLELQYPVVFNKQGGYIAHLTTLHIHLRGDILNEIRESDLEILKYHKDRNPLNPLFQAAYHKYATGNLHVAVVLLLKDNLWPSNNLPTTNNYCAEYVIQRDYTNKDWGPCKPEFEHTGAELVVLYELFIKDGEYESRRDSNASQ